MIGYSKTLLQAEVVHVANLIPENMRSGTQVINLVDRCELNGSGTWGGFDDSESLRCNAAIRFGAIVKGTVELPWVLSNNYYSQTVIGTDPGLASMWINEKKWNLSYIEGGVSG